MTSTEFHSDKALTSRSSTFPFRAGSATARGRQGLLCFSHLRWNFVYQRPQHLMTRFASTQPIFFFEEPVFEAIETPRLNRATPADNITILTPVLPVNIDEQQKSDTQRNLLDAFLACEHLMPSIRWYYTPMSLAFSEHIDVDTVVYDCMDELSAFRGAPASLVDCETSLLARADVVFTGGFSLYEAKRRLHANVHAFPSSVDASHFRQARADWGGDVPDQAAIPTPRLGFFGVLDERFDLDLLSALADARPDWNFVLIGPVVKIDPSALPRRLNLHYLGQKSYEELPRYLAGWDVALMPFARNESTRFISPTKTPEYLAGGRMVVSTPIPDVVASYGDTGVVKIADGAEAFEAAIEEALRESAEADKRFARCDAAIEHESWDNIASSMTHAIERIGARLRQPAPSACVVQPAMRQPPRRATYDFIIVGAGFAGSVLAERLANGLDKKVLLIDKRPHVGGNAHDYYDAAGILVHRYGPHIFHTNAQRIVDYLSQFTAWRQYEHRVLASVDDMLVPMPINLTTLKMLYHREFTPETARIFLEREAVHVAEARTSEDVVISKVGRTLYERFYRGYTRKQWGLDPSELDAAVAARIPVRTTIDDRYFSDEFQQMPRDGYTKLFDRMLSHPNIEVLLNTEYASIERDVSCRELIYTGRIDEYFNYRFGRLPYRSLRFEHKTVKATAFQPAAVVNYPSEKVPYTRITEYKYLTGQYHSHTSLTYEFPSDEGEPYYPVPRAENAALYQRYLKLADATPRVRFVGRLATYRYYNMDQVVAQALATYERIRSETAPQGAQDAARAA